MHLRELDRQRGLALGGQILVIAIFAEGLAERKVVFERRNGMQYDAIIVFVRLVLPVILMVK